MNRNPNTPKTEKIRTQTLNILEINVNSIISNEKRASLTELLKRHKPDVARHRIQFRNYTFIRNDRQNAKQSAGTAILIKNNIKFETIEIDYLTKPAFETTIIKLKLQNDNNLFLIAVYATSSGKNERIEQNVRKLKNIQK